MNEETKELIELAIKTVNLDGGTIIVEGNITVAVSYEGNKVKLSRKAVLREEKAKEADGS